MIIGLWTFYLICVMLLFMKPFVDELERVIRMPEQLYARVLARQGQHTEERYLPLEDENGMKMKLGNMFELRTGYSQRNGAIFTVERILDIGYYAEDVAEEGGTISDVRQFFA